MPLHAQTNLATPASPPANKLAIFAGIDNRLYTKNSAGAIQKLAHDAAVVARAFSQNGQSISGSVWTIINYHGAQWDTHGAITYGAAWKYTIPVSGFYVVSATALTAQATYPIGFVSHIALWINGSMFNNLGRSTELGAAITGYVAANGSTIVFLNAGTYIDIRMYFTSNSATALIADGVYNHVSIHRVGS